LGHTDLDRLYMQVLSSSPSLPDLQLVLGAIILLGMPLSIENLARLLLVEVEHVQLVLEGLHSIVSIPEDPNAAVTVFHLSLREFLTSKDCTDKYFIDTSLKHTT
jgi:hypothetical protein